MPPSPTIRQLLAHAHQLREAEGLIGPAVAYDLFAVLGLRERETVHTALLADLLNLEGAYGLGDLFLTSFLHLAGVPAAATG